MSDVQVILADLARLADAFANGEAGVNAAAPGENGLRIDSGSVALNNGFIVALTACRIGRELIAQDMANTAANLRRARDAYERSDVRSRELFDNLMKIDPLGAA